MRSPRDQVCCSSRKRIEQGLRLLQIARVESLSEPTVDRNKKITGLLPLALIAPEPRKARRGAQLIGLCFLTSRDTHCLFDSALSLFKPVETAQGDAFEAMKFSLPLAMTCIGLGTQPVSRRRNSLVILALAYQRIGQHC